MPEGLDTRPTVKIIPSKIQPKTRNDSRDSGNQCQVHMPAKRGLAPGAEAELESGGWGPVIPWAPMRYPGVPWSDSLKEPPASWVIVLSNNTMSQLAKGIGNWERWRRKKETEEHKYPRAHELLLIQWKLTAAQWYTKRLVVLGLLLANQRATENKTEKNGKKVEPSHHPH